MTILLAINPLTGRGTRIHSRKEADEYRSEGWSLVEMAERFARHYLAKPCSERVRR